MVTGNKRSRLRRFSLYFGFDAICDKSPSKNTAGIFMNEKILKMIPLDTRK